MRALLIFGTCLLTSINIIGQEQSIEIIYDFSSRDDSALIYYHIKTNYPEIDKKIQQYPVNNILYMSPDEVLVNKDSKTITIDGGEFSMIEIKAKDELIETTMEGTKLFKNEIPYKLEADFDLSSFMWIFPPDGNVCYYSCNSEGKFTRKNNTLLFTAKKVNNLQFEIYFKDFQSDTLISQSIFYKSGEWKHHSKDYKTLEQIADNISNLKDYKIQISGHTSSVPIKSNKTNWELSAQRATDIVNVLIKLGVPEDKIEASFHSNPKSNLENKDLNKQNRRVDIHVINEKPTL